MIRVYDTAKRAKVALEPLAPGKLGIYVCGPTVYDQSHVGHARVYVAFDAIVRFLRKSGLEVTYVRNITDIDDKIIARAAELDEEPLALSGRFSEAFHQDMQRLGNADPDQEPKVSDHLPEIIKLIETLIEKKHAYAVEGDVYFEVGSLASYGELSRRNLDDLRSGARVDVDERKRSPLDFALWKTVKPGEPSWPSPWGPGRPGWHIECSAMSGRYLGERFDIHGGGMDLIFPHHENEIAQSKGCYGAESFARYWMHNGFVNVRGTKMSKSLGNFFTIAEVCRHHEPEALRLFLLGTHYRKPISFDIEGEEGEVLFPNLEESERRLSYMYRTVSRLEDALAVGKSAPDNAEIVAPANAFNERLSGAMSDDFNTAAALGHIAELFTLANKLLDQPKAAPKAARRRTLEVIVEQIGEVRAILGLLQESPETFLERRRDKLCKARNVAPAEVEKLLEERMAARQQKDFTAADEIRARLTEMGVEVMDRPQGSSWAIKEALKED